MSDDSPNIVHVYPVAEEHRHELEGLTCRCAPRLEIRCYFCGGDECEMCEQGMIEVDPGDEHASDGVLVIHNLLGTSGTPAPPA